MRYFKLTIYPLILIGIIAGGFFLFRNLTASPVSQKKLAQEFNKAPEIKKEYSIDRSVLKIEPKNQNDIGVVLGDAKSKDFVPDLEINKWDGETKFKLKPDISNIPADQKKITMDGDKINYETPKIIYQYYNKPDVSLDGGYEFSEILKTKPETNVFTTPIETENLDFFYQPALNQEKHRPEIVSCTETQCFDNKNNVVTERPENVVGSYAVYYTNGKKGDYTALGGKNYQAGKAFHIYRPQVIDAEGNKVWAELKVDTEKGNMNITVPQDFLDNAVYPVIVDPNFGYETVGNTPDWGDTNYILCSKFALSETGTPTHISIAAAAELGNRDIQGGIYDDSSPRALKAYTGTGISLAYAFATMAVSYAEQITAGNYWLCGNTNNYLYDSGASSFYKSQIFGTWPATISGETDYGNKKFSIYATYTASVSAPTVTTQAASGVAQTTATGNGNITDTGGENNDKRGFVYDTSSKSDPGNVAPGSSGYANYAEDSGTYGAGAFTKDLSSLVASTTYYARAYSHNSAGYSYGGEVIFATIGAATDFVSIIDTGGSGDYSSLSAWNTGVATDLTAATTKVFSGVLTAGPMGDNASVAGETSGATATLVHVTSTQILLESISGGPFQSGEKIWLTADHTKYFTTSDTGNSAIAVADCKTTTGAADTAAVSISGWGTDSDNYIKIWTDPSEGYRHQGVWDDNKYSLAPSLDSSSAIDVSEDYVQVDGLQIKVDYTGAGAAWTDGIRGTGISGGSSTDIQISNNIIKHTGNARWYSTGIEMNISSIKYKVWNNIVYGFTGIYGSSSGRGIYNNSGSPTLYVYNNTIYGCNAGLRNGDSAVIIAKNNLSYNNTTADYNGNSFDSSSTNNLSGDDTAPALNTYYQNATVSFVNENKKDFHLANDDTGAKNSGILLYDSGDDANLNFTTDIDGSSRQDAAGTWDIGADEGATAVYYSVGQNTSNHCGPAGDGNNCGNVTISAGLGTFDVPQAGTNLGVGDALVAGGNTYHLSYKSDTSHWGVITETGATPSNLGSTAVTSISHAFNSLYNAITGSDDLLSATNLVTGNYVLNIPCYNDAGAADTAAVTVSGYTTGLENYIKIYTPNNTTNEVNQTQRHSGKWDDNKFRMEYTGDGNSPYSAILLLDSYVHIDGLQVKLTNNGFESAALRINPQDSASTYSYLSNNILKGGGTENVKTRGIVIYSGGAYVWNNIIYDFTTTLSPSGGIVCSNWSGVNYNLYAYNNTIYNGQYGIDMVYGNASPYLYAKNNLVSNTSTAGFAESTGGLIVTAGSSNNASSDGTAPGANSRTSQTFSFVDATNKDFHLALADSGAKGYGANFSQDTTLSYSNDIDGQERTGNWSIGADEPKEAEMQSSTQKSQSITDGLVMYQSFDGGDISGTTSYDRSGNNNNGTISDATAAIGKRGQALSFDGNDSVSMPSLNGMVYPFTFAAWFKTSADNDSQTVVSQDNSNDSFQRVQLYYNSSIDTFCYNVRNGGNEAEPCNILNQDGNWHYAVGVSSASNNHKLYIDGVLIDTITSDVPIPTIDRTTIGDWPEGTEDNPSQEYYWEGQLDEVRVYNRALSVDEIGDLYTLGQEKIGMSLTNKNTNGLVGMWSFDGADMDWVNSSAEAKDRSGNGNDGDVVGATIAIGKKGQALRFDGASYIDTSDQDYFSPSVNDMTMSVWVNIPATAPASGNNVNGGAGRYFLAKGNTNQWEWGMENDNNTHLYISFWPLSGAGGQDYAVLNVDRTMNDGQWHNYTVSMDYGNLAVLYIDGVEGDNTNAFQSSMGNGTQAVRIGGRGTGNYFSGLIDEVRIYDRALSPDEVGDLYRLGQVKLKR